eukprot:130869-Pyramimonas_sp.AAC.1
MFAHGELRWGANAILARHRARSFTTIPFGPECGCTRLRHLADMELVFDETDGACKSCYTNEMRHGHNDMGDDDSSRGTVSQPAPPQPPQWQPFFGCVGAGPAPAAAPATPATEPKKQPANQPKNKPANQPPTHSSKKKPANQPKKKPVSHGTPTHSNKKKPASK